MTKGDICDYYADVAEVILPHVQDRPLTLQRFPNGIEEEGFFQKDVPDHFPEWIERVEVPKEEGGVSRQLVANNAATLVYCANQGVITLHGLLSRRDHLRHPDRVIFDLDPDASGEFATVTAAALDVRALFEELDVTGFVATTGSRGLHVAVPLDRGVAFGPVADFAREAAGLLASRRPDAYTTAFHKDERAGKLFLDTRRNYYGQTAVAPYAVRAQPGAPVAAPLDWDELADDGLHSQRYTTRNVLRRLADRGDPWKHMRRHAHSLDTVRRRLRALGGQPPRE